MVLHSVDHILVSVNANQLKYNVLIVFNFQEIKITSLDLTHVFVCGNFLESILRGYKTSRFTFLYDQY